MSERSVAEIIGWERNEGPGYTYWTRPGKVDGTPPNVDDLLAWWHNRVQLEAHVSIRWQDGTVTVELWEYDSALMYRSNGVGRPEIVCGQGTTLLVALEAAVRKVADEETT